MQRDLRQLAQVGDSLAFLSFLKLVAARTSQLLNYSDLARDAGISTTTARNWLSVLESSGLVTLLQPYHANIGKRLIKAPKMYFTDTGLCSYLTGWSSPETLEAGAMSGAMLETWVVGELLKSYYNIGLKPELFFFRDSNGTEIDILIHKDGLLFPIEIKKTGNPSKHDVRHILLLEKAGLPLGPGALLCLYPKNLILTENIWAQPISWLG